MAQYLKMTNGAASFLVDVKDTSLINEKLNEQFYAQLDKDGDPVVIESDSLIKGENAAVNELLNMVKNKQSSKKSNTNKR